MLASDLCAVPSRARSNQAVASEEALAYREGSGNPSGYRRGARFSVLEDGDSEMRVQLIVHLCSR